ncbi:hypothetical protein [Chlorogloea sp. CCALA 695]|nr:hypothetical protein [Chlorogloea sp. CCALA 695]
MDSLQPPESLTHAAMLAINAAGYISLARSGWVFPPEFLVYALPTNGSLL